MRQRAALDAQDALSVVTAASAKARDMGANVAIAVVDEGAHLWRVERADYAIPFAGQLSISKARTAALLQMPSEMLGKLLPGHPGVGTLPDMVQMGGGVPLMVGDTCVGAIGVSGGDEDTDRTIAEAGAKILSGRTQAQKLD